MSEKQEFVYRVVSQHRIIKKFVSKISAAQTISYAYHRVRIWNKETHRYDRGPYDGKTRVLRAPVGEWQDVTEEFGYKPGPSVIQEGSS